MNHLIERLNGLYTERADIQERMATLKRNPEVQKRMAQAALDAKIRRLGSEASISEIFHAGIDTWLRLEELQEEQKWIEKQILALLTNPALAARDFAS